MSQPAATPDPGAIDPQDAALVIRLVERRCPGDAPLLLAVLGLDQPLIPVQRREPCPQVIPHPYRKATTGRRR